MTESQPSWKNIVDVVSLELPNDEWAAAYSGAHKSVSAMVGAKKLGFSKQRIDPGCFTCPYHFHHGEEEVFIVLEGKAMLRMGGEFRQVSQGELIFFPTGEEGTHQFYNHTDAPCVVFAFSNKEPLDVCEYPDSNKLLVKAVRKLYDIRTEVDYLSGEADPSVNWPEEYLRKK